MSLYTYVEDLESLQGCKTSFRQKYSRRGPEAREGRRDTTGYADQVDRKRWGRDEHQEGGIAVWPDKIWPDKIWPDETWPDEAESGINACSLLQYPAMDTKVILMHGFSQEEAVAAMRLLKQGMETAKDAAFALTTPTNLEWKVSDLLEHVSEEHEQMKQYQKSRGSH